MPTKVKSDLASMIERYAVIHGSFRLASGKESDYYIDCRQIVLRSDGLHLIADSVIRILQRYPETDAIGGPVTGADPIIGAVLVQASPVWRNRKGLIGFQVRKYPKDHGLARWIEGPLEPGMRVAIVEDTITSGRSVQKAIDATREMGCDVRCVIAVVDREEGASELFADQGIDFHSLVKVSDLDIKHINGVA